MRNTSDLIDALVEAATPVRRLRPPWRRAALWFLVAAIVLVLLCIAHGVRTDISMRLREPVFILSMIGALATAILAALAAFELSLPDSSRWWLLLPAPGLATWVTTIGYGCLTDWVRMDPEGVQKTMKAEAGAAPNPGKPTRLAGSRRRMLDFRCSPSARDPEI